MRRRDFLTFAGGALAWPLSANAQPARPAVIGFLGANTATIQKHSIAALVQRLNELGWAEGRNLHIEYRWAEGRYDRSPALIAELLERKVDVIVTHAPPNVLAAKRATSVVPIVFAAVGDPVGIGLVQSLARPGGNATGLSLQSADLAGKRLQLFRELLPHLRTLAVIGNAANTNNVMERDEIRLAAKALDIEPLIPDVKTFPEIVDALKAVQGRIEGLFVQTDPLTNTSRVQIGQFALAARLPTSFGAREYAEAAGLMSYGPSFTDLFRRAGDFVDKILRGANPADLPVQQPTQFELVFNLRTAKVLDIEIPSAMLARADDVIE